MALLSTATRAVETVALALVRPDDPKTRKAAAGVSESARQGRVWIVLSALGLMHDRTRRPAIEGMVGWALASSAAFGLKGLTHRDRPKLLAPSGRAPQSSSMPSSHTAGAVAYATAASLAAPALATVVVPLAALVGWSRSATGRHFPTDVVVGAALGLAAGSAAHAAMRRAVRPRAARSSSATIALPLALAARGRVTVRGGRAATEEVP